MCWQQWCRKCRLSHISDQLHCRGRRCLHSWNYDLQPLGRGQCNWELHLRRPRSPRQSLTHSPGVHWHLWAHTELWKEKHKSKCHIKKHQFATAMFSLHVKSSPVNIHLRMSLLWCWAGSHNILLQTPQSHYSSVHTGDFLWCRLCRWSYSVVEHQCCLLQWLGSPERLGFWTRTRPWKHHCTVK